MDVAEAHRKAHATDPVSAFGGVIATNREVSAAMAELESGSGVVWGEGLPSAEDIGRQVQRDLRQAEEAPSAYSVLRDGRGDKGDPEHGAF